MEQMFVSQLRESERKVLAVFERHGADGRAITVETLAANAGMQKNMRELAAALQNLARRRMIKRAGHDPLPGSPVAFRLAIASSDQERVGASNLPLRRSPPLTPDSDETTRSKTGLGQSARLPAD